MGRFLYTEVCSLSGEDARCTKEGQLGLLEALREAISGRMAARGRGGESDTADEVKFEFTELVPSGSLKAPEYGRHFSENASRRFVHQCMEYEEALQLSNMERTVQAALPTVTELVPKHIRARLSCTILDGSVLDDGYLKEALGRHAKCWKYT